MANVAVLGYGTVGSGVFETLNTNAPTIAARCGEPVLVKYVLDIRDFPGNPVEKYLVREYETILNDDSVNVVIEVMGGLEPAFTFAKSALEKGKSVVTSNKELVAKRGARLLAIARENNASFMFEASVGGGMPIIRPLNQSLAAEDIYEIRGILNGTTNYILTKMNRDEICFEAALKKAQEKGYAERVPDADILGLDAARKIAILSSLAYGGQVDFEDVYTEGIDKITYADTLYAKKAGAAIKLIAESRRIGESRTARVCPIALDRENPLSNVDGVFNAAVVKGNTIGEVMFYGKGAGKYPTASAVISDVIDCVKLPRTNIRQNWDEAKITLTKRESTLSRFIIRFREKGGAQIDGIKEFFPAPEVIKAEGVAGEFAVLTELIKESAFDKAKERFGSDIINAFRADENLRINKG